MKGLTLKQKQLFYSIYAIALILIIYCFLKGYFNIRNFNLEKNLFFILIIGLTESVTLYFRTMSFSTTFAITLATYIIFGPFESLICLLGGFLIRVLQVNKNTYKHLFNTPLYGTMFNCSMFTISFLTSHLLVKLSEHLLTSYEGIIGILLFSLTYFFINKLILAMLQSTYTGKRIRDCLENEFILSLISYLIMIPFGIMFAILYINYNYWGIIIPLFPVLLVRYTFTYYAEAKLQYINTVETLMNAIDARDCYTQGHSKRVAEVASILAKDLGYKKKQIEKIRIAAMLHDIGKIGIRDYILHKPTGLTEEEFKIIKSHPEIGEGIINNISNLQYTKSIIRGHHERFDGKGYPDGKKGTELSLEVYIIQLADTVDAMASDRPYRKGLSQDTIIEELKRGRGYQFHPTVVDSYLKCIQVMPEIKQIWE